MVLLLACAPALIPDWTPGDELDPQTWQGPVPGRDDPRGDPGDSGVEADPVCADYAGSWSFELEVLSGDCAIPTPTSFDQSLSCDGDRAFSFEYGGMTQICTLAGSAFGCHSPDPDYSFSLSGSFDGDEATGTWTWVFPSNCDSVSGTFVARR